MRGRLKKHTQNAQNQEFPFFACPCVGVAVGLLEVILAAKRLFLSLGGCVMTFLHICKKCVVQKLQKTLGNEALMPLNPAVQCYNKILFSPSSVYFHYFFLLKT